MDGFVLPTDSDNRARFERGINQRRREGPYGGDLDRYANDHHLSAEPFEFWFGYVIEHRRLEAIRKAGRIS